MENRRFIGRLLSDATVEDAFHPERPRRTIPSTDLPEDSWVQVEVDGSVTSLAAPGSARAQIYALAADKALDPIHPAPVLTEADERFANPQIDAPDLLDLRHLPFVTIDEKTSKDLDQALCIQRAGDGWCVWYAIADAAWFVRPGKPLFEEALRRGATCYMPGLIIPMLPTNLSEDIVSLNPGVDRRALVFRMILAPDGARRGCDILRGRINSKAKLDYDTVDAWLKGDAPPPTDHPEALQSLRYLQTVGQIRIQQAVERDVVRLRRVESAVKLRSDRGLRFVAFADPRNDVERYNEQISLLCNMEGARYLLEDAPDFLQPIFRVHPPPSEARLDSMREMIDAIIGAHRLDRRVWSWDPRGESLATYLDRLPRGGEQGRLARAIHRQAMMSNGRSSFTAAPGLHHGVGAEAYARFSAPMREVVGVYVHRQCWEKMNGAPLDGPRSEALRQAVIDASNRARNLQRALDHETNRLVLDQLFEEDLACNAAVWRTGTVMGMTRSKVHVQLDEPGIDVKVYRYHLEAQGGQRLTVDNNVLLRPDEGVNAIVRVGDAVQINVIGRDRDRDRWVLGLKRP